jgi:hypothetical protein
VYKTLAETGIKIPFSKKNYPKKPQLIIRQVRALMRPWQTRTLAGPWPLGRNPNVAKASAGLSVASGAALMQPGHTWGLFSFQNFVKFFKIFRHIESLDTCMKHKYR